MTTTLTLSPDATTASVLITANTDAAGVTITRTDQNGVAPVRLLAGQQLGQAVAIRDYEAALVGPVRYTCTTTTPVELRRNECPNPSAETATTGYGGVNSGSGASVERSTERAWYGAASIKYTYGAGTAPDSGPGLPGLGGLPAGVALTVSVWVYAPAAIGSGLRLICYGSAVSNQTLRGAVSTTVGEWTRLTISPTTTAAGGLSFAVGKFANGNEQGKVVYLDAVLYERSSTVGEYFDGSTPGAQWTGAANASPSVIRGIETVERIVRFDEGAHEVAADVWSVVERPQYGARGRVTLSQSLTATDRSTRHEIIGRADPVFIMQRGGFRTGTVEVLCLDVATVDAFYQLAAQAGIVQARTARLSPGQRLLGDLYVKVTGVTSDTVQGTAPWRFRVRLTIAEVRRPTGPLLGDAVWTYDALPSSSMGLTYEGLSRAFDTYNDLAAGVMSDG